ncbi:hypothetical protein [Planosporangium mesophilum]|nr:hypothetical protein [Planosporangium mesophilum]
MAVTLHVVLVVAALGCVVLMARARRSARSTDAAEPEPGNDE